MFIATALLQAVSCCPPTSLVAHSFVCFLPNSRWNGLASSGAAPAASPVSGVGLAPIQAGDDAILAVRWLLWAARVGSGCSPCAQSPGCGRPDSACTCALRPGEFGFLVEIIFLINFKSKIENF